MFNATWSAGEAEESYIIRVYASPRLNRFGMEKLSQPLSKQLTYLLTYLLALDTFDCKITKNGSNRKSKKIRRGSLTMSVRERGMYSP